jgi:hypothetical protein
MDKVKCHRDKLIEYLPRIYVARISDIYSCVSLEKRGTSENKERNCLEFNTSEKSVQEIRCRRRRFNCVIFLIPEFTFIEKHVFVCCSLFSENFACFQFLADSGIMTYLSSLKKRI